MLSEREQLADHEARIGRQELPPLQQPLENIIEIKGQLGDMHRARTCGEITAEQVALAMLPAIISAKKYDYVAGYILSSFRYADLFIAEMNRRKQKND